MKVGFHFKINQKYGNMTWTRGKSGRQGSVDLWLYRNISNLLVSCEFIYVLVTRKLNFQAVSQTGKIRDATNIVRAAH
jgi:hypothetical protein